MTQRNLPHSCPSCKGPLIVVKLECSECGTEVTGDFTPCPVCHLDGETRKLFDLFLNARGNLKDVQRSLRISYPTVRVKIERMFRKLNLQDSSPDPLDILARVKSGDITVEQAEKLLRGER